MKKYIPLAVLAVFLMAPLAPQAEAAPDNGRIMLYRDALAVAASWKLPATIQLPNSLWTQDLLLAIRISTKAPRPVREQAGWILSPPTSPARVRC